MHRWLPVQPPFGSHRPIPGLWLEGGPPLPLDSRPWQCIFPGSRRLRGLPCGGGWPSESAIRSEISPGVSSLVWYAHLCPVHLKSIRCQKVLLSLCSSPPPVARSNPSQQSTACWNLPRRLAAELVLSDAVNNRSVSSTKAHPIKAMAKPDKQPTMCATNPMRCMHAIRTELIRAQMKGPMPLPCKTPCKGSSPLSWRDRPP